MKSKFQEVPIPLGTQGRSEEAQFVIREQVGPVGSGKTIMMDNKSCKAMQMHQCESETLEHLFGHSR